MKIVLWASPASRRAMEARLKQISGATLVNAANEAEVIAALPDADVITLQVFNYTPAIAQAVRENAPKLRFFQLLTVGYDRLLKEKIPGTLAIATAGDSLSPVVAEHALSLILALMRRVPEALTLQGQRKWDASMMGRMASLDRKTVAVVGHGSIGSEIGRMAKAFGARVIGLSRSAKPSPHAEVVRPIAELDAVLGEADVVAIATPLTDETTGMFDAARIARMKDGAFLINISRGPVADTNAIAAALASGKLAGAGLDVTDPEPPPPDHPIWSAPNVILTPHVAVGGASQALAAFAGDNIERFMRGEPVKAPLKL